jgi:hypothetical protein
MAYMKGMHNIVSIIDIFHNETDGRIVKYLGKKLIDREKKQQQAVPLYDSSSQSIHHKSGVVVSPKVGMSLYEKRMQAYRATQTFVDATTGEAFEVSQLLLENNPETDAKNAQTAAANITYSEMVSLMNEIDQIKPPSGYLDDEDEDSVDDMNSAKNEKMLTVKKNKHVISSQTIDSNAVQKNLTELVLEKIKQVERVQSYAHRDPAKQRKLNNRKSFSYGEYTVDLVVKDRPQETSRSDENSVYSFGSETMMTLMPPKSAASQPPPGSQYRQRRDRLQSSKSTKSTKSNYDINVSKECEIVDVYAGPKSAISRKSENLEPRPHMNNKPRTPGSKLASNIPHMVPESVVQFNPNETFYAKKPSTAVTMAASLSSVVVQSIIKKGTVEKHLNKMNNFYYLNELANTNRTATRHLVDELKRNERTSPILPLFSSRDSKTVRYEDSPSARKNSSPVRKQQLHQRGESEAPYNFARFLVSRQSLPPNQQQTLQRVSNKTDVYNSENQIMTKYLDSLKRSGLYNQNSKPIVRNILVETSKSRDKSQRSY